MREQTGFSLMEVLISIAILAFIGAITFGTFSRALSSRERAEAISSHYHEIRQAMLRMAREISMAFLSEHRECEEPRTRTIFVGKRAEGGMRLDFTSFSHVRTLTDANESDQNELSYFIDQHPEHPSEAALFRREQNRIDEEPDEGGTTQLLAESISELRFEFYDAKEDEWEETWDTTSSDYRGRLPLFVAIHAKAKAPDGQDEEFVTKTRVFMKQPLLIPGSLFSKCVD